MKRRPYLLEHISHGHTAQVKHVDSLVAPTVSEYLPAAHDVQLSFASVCLYLLAAHATQCPNESS